MYLKSQRGTNDFSNSCFSSLQLERPQSRRADPLLLIHSFQFRSAFRSATTPGQSQIMRPLPSLTHVVLIVVWAFFGTCTVVESLLSSVAAVH